LFLRAAISLTIPFTLVAPSISRYNPPVVPIRKILQLGDPGLRQIAFPVSDPSAPCVGDIVTDLADTLAFSRATTGYGRAIAAPQIGVNERIIFLQLQSADPWPLINPVITARSEEKIVVWDCCLSFLSIFMQVQRHREIEVRYQDRSGRTCELRAADAANLSELLQHEIDHLDGILCVDRMTDIRTLCTREEFERRCRDQSPYASPSISPAA
jgi:peptide deformylase